MQIGSIPFCRVVILEVVGALVSRTLLYKALFYSKLNWQLIGYYY